MNAQSSPEWPDFSQEFLKKQQELWAILMAKSGEMVQKPTFRQDPMALQQSVLHYWAEAMKHPERIIAAQKELFDGYMKIAQQTSERLQGREAPDIIPLDKGDRRFRDPRWVENPVFDYLRQTYLLLTRWTQDKMLEVETDPVVARKLRFAMRQYSDALSPSNFWMTNPEVLDETMKTRGQNLLRGMENMIRDLKENSGLPKVSMVKKGLFEVGKNLATTPGKVVFQNDLVEIIQYEATTKDVYKAPLVIIPPWINKYYILDMQPENSFVKAAVDQGHTVFIASWANPDESHRDLGWYDYMAMGLQAAIKAAQDATGEKQVNVVGYCIGGTLLTSLLAYQKAKGEKSAVKSATYLVTLIDFEDSGELTVFTDEAQIASIEQLMNEKGYLDAWHMHTTFNMLRANDLIWSFVVNNYLLGREPFPFDLLYWNSDSTRIPAACHSFYLREMYLHNNLARAGRLMLNDTALNVHDIDTPAYFISAAEDHIAPWKNTYAGAKLLGGDVTFTLAGSGHIAGIVNPPSKNKYGYWTNNKLPNGADEWLVGAKQFEGSWWTDWYKWLARHGGTKVPARKIKKPIENAPGSYVKVMAL
jgi:polyhydroxyalkanoate synthase